MNTFMKKSSYLFLASTILASTAATTVGMTGGVVAKATDETNDISNQTDTDSSEKVNVNPDTLNSTIVSEDVQDIFKAIDVWTIDDIKKSTEEAEDKTHYENARTIIDGLIKQFNALETKDQLNVTNYDQLAMANIKLQRLEHAKMVGIATDIFKHCNLPDYQDDGITAEWSTSLEENINTAIEKAKEVPDNQKEQFKKIKLFKNDPGLGENLEKLNKALVDKKYDWINETNEGNIVDKINSLDENITIYEKVMAIKKYNDLQDDKSTELTNKIKQYTTDVATFIDEKAKAVNLKKYDTNNQYDSGYGFNYGNYRTYKLLKFYLNNIDTTYIENNTNLQTSMNNFRNNLKQLDNNPFSDMDLEFIYLQNQTFIDSKSKIIQWTIDDLKEIETLLNDKGYSEYQLSEFLFYGEENLPFPEWEGISYPFDEYEDVAKYLQKVANYVLTVEDLVSVKEYVLSNEKKTTTLENIIKADKLYEDIIKNEDFQDMSNKYVEAIKDYTFKLNMLRKTVIEDKINSLPSTINNLNDPVVKEVEQIYRLVKNGQTYNDFKVLYPENEELKSVREQISVLKIENIRTELSRLSDIKDVHSNISNEQKEQIALFKTLYSNLDTTDINKLNNEEKAKCEVLLNIVEAKAINDRIIGLIDTLLVNNHDAIYTLMNTYDSSLTSQQKSLVLDYSRLKEAREILQPLDALKKRIENIKSDSLENQLDNFKSDLKTYQEYDEEKKAMFSSEFKTKLSDLIEESKKYDYSSVIDKINELGNPLDEKLVVEARTLYNTLSTLDIKAKVENYSTLTAAEVTLVKQKIDALPSTQDITESNFGATKTAVEAVKEAYDKLDENVKSNVDNYSKLTQLQSFVDERTLVLLQDQIKQLPTVSAATINDYKTIQAISEQYEQLGDNKAKLTDVHQLTDLQVILPTLKKAYETSQAIEQLPSADTITVEYENAVVAANKQLNTLTDAEVKYVPKAQEEKLNALVTKIKEQVQALINNLPAAITLEHENQVRQVRAAYDNLDDLNSELFITKLTAAEQELAKLKDEQTIVQSIQKAIEQLPDLTSLTLAHENAVHTIVDNYKQLTKTQQEAITNYSRVTIAQEKLNMLKENDKPIQTVIAQIQQLPSANALTLADESKVTEARQAYNNLSSAQRASVTNADKLDVLEEKITLLKQAQAMPVEAVIALIQKIPTTITLDDQAKIEEARERYNDLTATQQQVVTNYAALQKAESTLDSLIKASNEKIIAVQTLISNLPTSSKITVGDKEVIEAAREAYNALSLTEQQLVTNYTTLQKAEAALKNVSTDEEKEVEQDPEVLAVEQAIHALPTYSKFTIKDANALINARDLYDKLTRLQQATVSNYETLLVLEDKLDMLQKAEEEKEDAKTETPSETEKPSSTTDFSNLTGSTKTVAQLINTLPSVDKITLDNGAVLNATYKAFSALSKAEQEKIPNAFTLVIAKAIYDDLQLEEDQKVAKKAIAKIASLPTVSLVNLSDEAAIAEAKAAYAQLDANQKALVTNYATITQLESQIASLKTAALNVQQTISTLPAASQITENNRSAIETARAKYTALTTSQKKLVKNVALLDAAEQKLAENQTETVKKLINTINEWPNDITLNEESAIQQARKTYNALPSLQQKAITNYATLLQAETQLAALLNTDRAIAEVVDAMINDLPFTITAKDQAAVEQARKAYRALTASQKLYVANISVLDKAEATLLAAADNDLKAAKAVVTAIDSLPNEQVVTIEDADNVVAVRDAYRQLTTIQKGYVDNYDTLKAIEAALTTLEAREKALKAADVEIDIPTVKNTTKTIEGYVTPGAKVAVYIGSQKIATAKVDKDGYYSVDISRQQAGKELKFIVFNEIGDKLLREYVKVKAATVTAASALKASPTKISGKAPKNKTVTVYKGSKKLKTAKSTANGKFSVKLPKQVKGSTLKVIVSDSVGNKSKSKTVKVK